MQSARMSCRRANENYRVVVRHPKSLSRRCEECWIKIRSLGACCRSCLWFCCIAFLIVLAVAIYFSWWWIAGIVQHCHKTPSLGLQDLSIRDMAVYQNTTTDTTWQVKSAISVNLSAWNTNTVAGCFATYRRMVVHVEFKGQVILRQEVPLGFGLKPRRSRPVLLELQGDHFPLKTELGSLLQSTLRNGSAVGFQFFFDTRYLRNDRKPGWMRMGCDVLAKTPGNNPSQVSYAGGLEKSSCMATS